MNRAFRCPWRPRQPSRGSECNRSGTHLTDLDLRPGRRILIPRTPCNATPPPVHSVHMSNRTASPRPSRDDRLNRNNSKHRVNQHAAFAGGANAPSPSISTLSPAAAAASIPHSTAHGPAWRETVLPLPSQETARSEDAAQRVRHNFVRDRCKPAGSSMSQLTESASQPSL